MAATCTYFLQRLIFPKPIILILTHVHYHHYQPYTTVTVNTTICKQCPLWNPHHITKNIQIGNGNMGGSWEKLGQVGWTTGVLSLPSISDQSRQKILYNKSKSSAVCIYVCVCVYLAKTMSLNSKTQFL